MVNYRFFSEFVRWKIRTLLYPEFFLFRVITWYPSFWRNCLYFLSKYFTKYAIPSIKVAPFRLKMQSLTGPISSRVGGKSDQRIFTSKFLFFLDFLVVLQIFFDFGLSLKLMYAIPVFRIFSPCLWVCEFCLCRFPPQLLNLKIHIFPPNYVE